MQREAFPVALRHFLVHRDLASFDFEVDKVDSTLIAELAGTQFSDAAHNVVLIGGSGTGKTHLATALCVKTITGNGKRVRFYSTMRFLDTKLLSALDWVNAGICFACTQLCLEMACVRRCGIMG